MNERLKELLTQASSTHYQTTTRNGGDVYKTVVDNEKFAKLIINECMETIAGCNWPSWAEACDAREVFVEAIVEHFGIPNE